MRTANQLQVGDTFTKNGTFLTVTKVEKDKYRLPSNTISVECTSKKQKEANYFFSFNLNTKI